MPRVLIAIVVFGVLAAAVPAQAQGRPGRPYRGLFGAGVGEFEQSLTASATVGGAWDTNLAASTRDTDRLRSTDINSRGGGLGQFSGGLSYRLSRGRFSFGAGASSSGRYYPSAPVNVLRRESASAQASLGLFWGIGLTGNASYRPYSLSALYPTLFAPEAGESSTDFELASSRQHFVSYSGGAGWSRQLARRTTLDAGYRYSGRATSVDRPDYKSQSGNIGLRHNIAQGMDFTAGYSYGQAFYEGRDTFVRQSIDLGIDYNRALSFSRQTTLSFRTGTTAFANPNRDNSMRFRVIGSASLQHELGRSWGLALTYNRNLRFSEEWIEPVYSDSVVLRATGLLNRRFRVHGRAGASTGRVGLGEEGGFDSFFADTGLGFALARMVNTGVSYRYHYHVFDESVALAPGVPSYLDRHSVHAFISVVAPLFQRTGVRNAAR